MSIIDYSTTPSSNTSLFPENMAPSAVNNGMRQVQADIRGGVHLRVTSKAVMSAIDPSKLAAGDNIILNYRSAAGDSGGGFFRVTKSDISTEVTADTLEGIYIPFDTDATGASGGFIREYDDFIDPAWFGAKGDDSTDDTAAIQAAVDHAATIGGLTIVDLMGRKYQTTDEINIATKVILRNGYVQLTTATANKAILSMGIENGTGAVVRPAGFENIYAKTSSTASGLTGFRMDGFVRSSWIKNCYAEMAGDLADTYGHVGFEIAATRIAVTSAAGGSSGAYENVIDNCTALFANTGFKAYTRGTAAQAYGDPQANGNIIRGNAYSCRQRAIWLDEGANENTFFIRADTFPSQAGQGTTVAVAKIDGRYNKGEVWEEIGSVGDTQYTVHAGANSLFNRIDYHTQNVVTAKVKDDSTDTHKNIFRQLGSGPYQGPEGGETDSIAFYADAVGTSTTATIITWVAPSKCVVTKAIAKMATTITNGAAQVYIAKNGSTSTDNRLYFDSTNTTDPESLTTLVAAGTAIDSIWLLDEGDSIDVIVNNTSASETKTVKGSFSVMYTGV